MQRMDHNSPALSTNSLEIKETIVYMLNEADISLLDDARGRGHGTEREPARLLVLAAIEHYLLAPGCSSWVIVVGLLSQIWLVFQTTLILNK